jgi:hypothetical protein
MAHIVPFFWESFNGHRGQEMHSLQSIIPYLENLHLFGYVFPPLLNIIPLVRLDVLIEIIEVFKMLFVKCSRTCQPIICNSAKLKLKQKVLY